MAERAGTARAREFVMTGRLYDAQTLHGWGVVNRVVAPEDLLVEKARRFAADLAAGPTVAHAATRRSSERRPATASARPTSAPRS